MGGFFQMSLRYLNDKEVTSGMAEMWKKQKDQAPIFFPNCGKLLNSTRCSTFEKRRSIGPRR
jgi:hypothetical protein